MSAAPFTATIVLVGQKSQRPLHIRCTISDVAAAYWIFPDGSNTLQLPSDDNWILRDVLVVTGGTDTTQSQVYLNQLNTGIVLDHKSNLTSVQNRQFLMTPISFRAGSNLKLVQAA
jgi:hypothetical protein